MQEDDAVVADVGPVERRADRLRGAETDRRRRAGAPSMCVTGDVLETLLEEDDQRAEADAEAKACAPAHAERLELIAA